MGLKIRAALLLCLAALAVYAGAAAVRSLRPVETDALPEELYAELVSRSGEAEYVLGSYEGYVAVFADAGEKTPQTVTAIELESLRDADRAMLRRGIPAADLAELLALLEDLGS